MMLDIRQIQDRCDLEHIAVGPGPKYGFNSREEEKRDLNQLLDADTCQINFKLGQTI